MYVVPRVSFRLATRRGRSVVVAGAGACAAYWTLSDRDNDRRRRIQDKATNVEQNQKGRTVHQVVTCEAPRPQDDCWQQPAEKENSAWSSKRGTCELETTTGEAREESVSSSFRGTRASRKEDCYSNAPTGGSCADIQPPRENGRADRDEAIPSDSSSGGGKTTSEGAAQGEKVEGDDQRIPGAKNPTTARKVGFKTANDRDREYEQEEGEAEACSSSRGSCGASRRRPVFAEEHKASDLAKNDAKGKPIGPSSVRVAAGSSRSPAGQLQEPSCSFGPARVLSKLVALARRLFRMGWRCMRIGWHFSPLLALSAPSAVCWRFSARMRGAWFACLLRCIERCGPAFIKFAQWAATRPDLFPDTLCLHLSDLHSFCTPHCKEASVAVLERTFGPQHESILKLDIDGIPVGSGCIAQVHRGVWYGAASGPRRVAVKILHPGVREVINSDLEILSFLAVNIEYYLPFTRFMVLTEAVNQFSEILYGQTDLCLEAENTKSFARNFADMKGVRFPEILFAQSDMLVESFEDGLPMQHLLRGWERHDLREDAFRADSIRKRTGGSKWGLGNLFGKRNDDDRQQEKSSSSIEEIRHGGTPDSAGRPRGGNDIAENRHVGEAEGDDDEDEVGGVRLSRKASAGRWLNLFEWQEKAGGHGSPTTSAGLSTVDGSTPRSRSTSGRSSKVSSVENPSPSSHRSSHSASASSTSPHSSTHSESRTVSKTVLRRKSGYPPEFLQKLSSLAMKAYLKMLFHDRFVHADLHPGNMFFKISPEGDPELIYLDCGLAISLSEKDSTDFNDCVYALLHGKPEDAAHLIIKRSPGDKKLVRDEDGFARKVGVLIEDFRDRKSRMHVAHVTGKLLLYAGQHNVTLESSFVNVALSLAVMDGLGRQLQEDFNVFRAATPFLAEAAVRYATGYK
ncbi:unnamed protein product [Amoebophrya sp. A25]|nr:unnamed protein product [Amoebophrya sp. A25]|eukprot:GSA25T00001723001.1